MGEPEFVMNRCISQNRHNKRNKQNKGSTRQCG